MWSGTEEISGEDARVEGQEDMRIIQPSVTIETSLQASKVYTQIEWFGRTAYKSEKRITEESTVPFIRKLIASGHESILEHVSISVRFICDRGVSHELVRHRIAAYTQESTRYVDYSRRGMEVIAPVFWQPKSTQWNIWENAMLAAEGAYNHLLLGASPQQARSVLPNSLKTEIVATMNIRQWRHVLRQRTSTKAHPQMRQVMLLLLGQLQSALPILFEDIQV